MAVKKSQRLYDGTYGDELQYSCLHLNDKDRRSVHLENKWLLVREKAGLRKMIMENKDRRELSSSAAAANVKTEPKGDSVVVVVSSYPDKGDVLNGNKPSTKVKCEKEDNLTVSEGGVATCSVVTTSSSSAVDKKPAVVACAGPPADGASAASQKQPTTPVSAGHGVGSGSRSRDLPCDVVNSVHDDASGIDDDSLVMIKDESMCSTPSSIKEEKPHANMLPVSGPMPAASMGPCIGQSVGMQQPMPGAIIHKQPSTMEAQYMQQQSQIFVFSTQMANKAAETVLQGQFPSIIAYHCGQPGTKRFLEKHPLKIQQFSRQNPAMWLNSLAQMKQNRGPSNMFKTGMMPNAMYGGGGGDHFGPSAGPTSGWMMNSRVGGPPHQGAMGAMPSMEPGLWPSGGPRAQQRQPGGGNPMYSPISSPVSGPMSGPVGCPMERTPPGPMGNPTANVGGVLPSQQQQQQFPMNVSHGPSPGVVPGHPQFSGMPLQSGGPNHLGRNMMAASQMVDVGQPTLTGVKVPDENLTPQQRQHREEQLAIIRNMHQMLFPDQHHGLPAGDSGDGMGSGPGGMVGHMPPGMMPGPCGPGSGSDSTHLQQQQQRHHHHHHAGEVLMQQGQPNMMMGHCPSGQAPSPESQLGGGGTVYPGHPAMGMMSPGPGGEVGPGGFCAGGGPPMMQQQRMMIPGQTGVSPASMATQMEWQKTQHLYYEERRRKHPRNQAQHGMQQTRPVGGGVGGGPMHSGFPVAGGPMQVHGLPGATAGQMGPGPGGGGIRCSPANVGLPSCCPGIPAQRVPGPPPPPYHQTPRNANPGSVGMGGPSVGFMPSPTSPSPNPTSSSLSLTSPRMSSGLSSPAEMTPRPLSATGNPRLPHPSPSSLQNTPMNSPNPRPLNPSNPGTPASVGAPMPSPGLVRKQNQDGSGSSSLPSSSSMDYSPSTPGSLPPACTQPQPAAEGMFGRTLQSYAQSQQRQQQQQNAQSPPKEPNLMPVPSPQQIQYLNTFDGQELTIQKQPNTSLREPNLLSPNGIPSNLPNKDGPGMNMPRTTMPGNPGSSESQSQHQGSRTAATIAQMQMGIMSEGYHGSMPQSPVERFPTPSSQSRPMSPGIDPGPRFSTCSSHPTAPGLSSSSLQSTAEARAQRFMNHMGEGNMRFMGSAQRPNMNVMPGMIDSSVQLQQRFQGSRQGNPVVMDGVPGPRFPGSGTESPSMRFPGNGPPVGQSGPGRPDPLSSPGFLAISGQGPNRKGNCGPCSGGMFVQMSPGKVCHEIDSRGCTPTGFGPMSAMHPGMLTSPVHIHGQRLGHFDPISSMAQMSQSLADSNGIPAGLHHPHLQPGSGGGGGGPLSGLMGNMSAMNMANMQVSVNSPGMPGSQPPVVNYQAGMQSVQTMQQQQPMIGQHCGAPGQVGMSSSSPVMHHPDMMNQVGHNVGPQTVNNTYVNATMSIQQLNIQNVTSSNYNPALQVQPMSHQQSTAVVNQMQPSGGPRTTAEGTNTVSSSVTMNPIVHSSVSSRNATLVQAAPSPQSHVRMSGPQQYPQATTGAQTRLAGPGVGAGPVQAQGPSSMAGVENVRGPRPYSSKPFNGANVQVKASAPNTIQYLPTRPQNAASAPPRPPSLEFLQRFTGPLSNVDGKGPGHGLQYFQHSGQQSQNMGMCMNMGMGSPHMAPAQVNPSGMASGMNPNMAVGGGGAARMVMMGPGPNVNPQSQCMPRGHHPSMVRMGPGGGPQQMVGGQMYGMFPSGPGEPSVYGNMAGQMMPVPAEGGMGPMSEHNGPGPLGYGGGSGVKGQMDPSQPLPPSVGHQAAGFKQSPYLGPTMTDPNYAQQFHNFQQQLYATNTRGGQMNSQGAMATNQAFFGSK